MAEGMFGAPVGFSAFQDDLYKDALRQESLGRTAMQPAQLRLTMAQAATAEQALQQEQVMAQLMRRSMGQEAEVDPAMIESGTGGVEGAALEQQALAPKKKQPSSMADTLDSLAAAAAGAGLATKAQELAKNAALIRSREAVQQSAASRALIQQLQAIKEQASLTGQLFGGVNDQESWDRANAVYQFQTGKPSPYANVPFSPELVETIKQQALTAKEEADGEEKKIARKSLDEFRKSRVKQHDENISLSRERNRIAREREARLRKNGGGRQIASPTSAELTQAKRLIGRDYKNLEATDLNDAAFTIAAEAKALRRANPALDASMAIQQAYLNAIQAGDFQDISTTIGGVKVPGMGKQTFAGRGKKPETAAALPSEKSKLVKDKYYVNPSGQIAQWNGKAFVLTRPLSSDNNRLDTNPDDLEDPDEADLNALGDDDEDY